MKIFLGDLVHDWEKVSLWTVPLNVGYIGAYAQKHFPSELEVRLFKSPEKMIAAIKKEKPDVVGLSYYVWNANLNNAVFSRTREYVPHALTVGGGPSFTSANATEDQGGAFFTKVPACDAFILNQGERGFVNLIARYRAVDGNRERLAAEPIPGVMINGLAHQTGILIDLDIEVIKDLDAIPSPYQNGMMDEFLAEPFVPLLETNRSCPYRCTFCAWGIGTGKLSRFSTERVFADIDYIGAQKPASANIFIVDANFSILERDVEIAQHLFQSHEKYGFPGHVGCQWNKSRPDRVMRVARELRGLSEVGASMQSLDSDVLDAIKRRNLQLEDVANMIGTLRSEGIETSFFSELILGLPNDSAESHLDANRKLMDLGAEVFNYNLHLLPGTEMDTPESRAKYITRTGWRLHDNAFGIYDGAKVFEGQEVVLGTNAMSSEELRSFRFIHFLIQFMWGRRWYYDFLQLFRNIGVHPLDAILEVIESFKNDEGAMGALYEKFVADHNLENFSSFEELEAFWSQEENLERLRAGTYGKLNYLYTYEILLDHFDSFNEMLEETAKQILAKQEQVDDSVVMDQCRDILAFSRERRIGLTKDQDELSLTKRRSFNYDLLAWRESGYEGMPAQISTSSRFNYEFFLTDRQQDVLRRQFEQFRSHNLNLTLRKMSEEMDAEEFFYKVRANPSKTEAEFA
jgi:radical SAM superfamily enzyme YgiQ (UPF0313 family)